MRKFLFGLLLTLALLFVPAVHAQTRVLVGGGGGSMYGNDFGQGVVRLEIPLGSHFEIDGESTFSPHLAFGKTTIDLQHKIGLGSGYAYSYHPEGLLWFTKSWALDGGFEQSAYHVTATSKTEYFVNGGFTYRRLWFGTPTRFSFDYVREIHNVLMANGDESNNLQGGSVTIDTRMGCKGPMCFRLVTNIQGGRVLNQGNPACDGTLGHTGGNGPHGTCPRTASMGGGASMSLLLEFPRRKATENDPF